MHQKLMKIVSTFLILVLALSTLSGCGDKKKPSSSASEQVNSQQESEKENTETETTTDSEEEAKDEYPVLNSQSGSYHSYEDATIRVDNSAYELYTYVDSTAEKYTTLVNKVADALKGQTTIYSIAIPTSFGVVLPDDIQAQISSYPNQGEVINKIHDKMSDDIVKVKCFPNLMKHRNEYLYFRTDFHWTARGAYYAYESFCEAKGITPIPLEERTEKQFDGFLGEFYWNSSNEDSALGNTPDIVYAYLPKSETAKMEYTDRNGKTYPWPIINDVTNYKASVKYSTFAAADNPIAVFQNPEVTDGSVCVVVKESYGNALLPYLVDHYSTIYEIDYRYWKGDLISFTKEKAANDLIFANNLSMIRSKYLIGKLNTIIN